jgi:aspartate-semialdehyde dehydrogenase
MNEKLLSKNISYTVAIVGASGAVGKEMLRVLEKRHFPIKKMHLLTSQRSAGKRCYFAGKELVLEELTPKSFEGVDIAFFSAAGSISQEYAPIAKELGAIVIDNSSAFRADPKVPLVVPEINGEDVTWHDGIIANPNCSTIISLMALAPLHQLYSLERVVASTYQAVSGTGAAALQELQDQVEALAEGREPPKKVYPHQIAFNLLPHVDCFLEDGYTREEMKFQNEGRRILHLPELKASVTCVRVPVYRAHAIAIHAEFQKRPNLQEVRQALDSFPGVDLVDTPEEVLYPMPLTSQGCDMCHVGRLRLDCSSEKGIAFWVTGDQLLKGAALNAVQIAELL